MIDYHRELIADAARTSAFREAIARSVRAGDVVVDLGCGTGILSFFACDAGARRVFAIDRSHMADVTELLARHVRCADRVTVLHELSTKVELPERGDVLVTEIIGAIALDEGILGYVIDARKRLLRDGAAILPRRIALHVAPVELREAWTRHVGFWDEPRFGFDFSPLRVFASSSIHLLKNIERDAYVAPAALTIDVDLTTVASTTVQGEARFIAARDALVHGFAMWFEAELVGGVTLTNRDSKTSHWAQAFFPLEEAVRVESGAEIALSLESDDGKVWRWRGSVGATTFDQTTWLAMPPCSAAVKE